MPSAKFKITMTKTFLEFSKLIFMVWHLLFAPQGLFWRSFWFIQVMYLLINFLATFLIRMNISKENRRTGEFSLILFPSVLIRANLWIKVFIRNFQTLYSFYQHQILKVSLTLHQPFREVQRHNKLVC